MKKIPQWKSLVLLFFTLFDSPKEKEVIDNQMKVEKHQRKHIKNAKKAQHEEACDEIFKDID